MGTPARPGGSASLRLERLPLTHPDARLLLEEVQQEYVVRYGGRDETPYDDAEFEPPGGAFFVGYLGPRAVAMGGWRWRPDVALLGAERAAEVKRMYVAPVARRAGHARTVLAQLEDSARAAGADVMVLETGTRQPEAIGLYLAAGYGAVEGFGHYAGGPLNRCFGRRL